MDIITDEDGYKIVVINDICFKGKRNIDWDDVEEYLKRYVGQCYSIVESSEKIYIGSDFPDEYAGSESRKSLKGAVAKAKANAAQGIPQLIQIASNLQYEENHKEKHKRDAKYGWYRYDVRFALPVYNDFGVPERYNVFFTRMLIRHCEDGKKYLYDLLPIKKETSKPLEQSLYGENPFPFMNE